VACGSRVGKGNRVGAGVGVSVGEGVKAGVLVTVGLAVGPGEAEAVVVNTGAAWDWQAARSRISTPDIRMRLKGNDAIKMVISSAGNSRKEFTLLKKNHFNRVQRLQTLETSESTRALF
jgi:hypothetical protein